MHPAFSQGFQCVRVHPHGEQTRVYSNNRAKRLFRYHDALPNQLLGQIMILTHITNTLRDRRISRGKYFGAALVMVAVATPLGYLLREILTTPEGVSPYYLEAIVAWGFFLLLVWTPIAVKRSHDIGLSGWWVLLLWLPFPLEFKSMLLINKYLGIELSGGVMLPAMFIGLAALAYTLVLFFMVSDQTENKWGCPNQALKTDAASGAV